MLSPSRAAVLEPDLKITTVKKVVASRNAYVTTVCQSHKIVHHMSHAFPSRQSSSTTSDLIIELFGNRTSLSLIERVFSICSIIELNQKKSRIHQTFEQSV